MSEIFQELRPYVDRAEAEGFEELAPRLEGERPVPRAGFRAELRSHLGRLERDRPVAWRPHHLGRLVAGYCGAGALLLAVAAIGLTGAGPLGY